jgi:acetolactate synthase-1/3 small subunit
MAEDYNTPDVSLLIYVHNRPGVLAKVASTFHRRAMNIQTLTVEPTEQPERSKMVVRVAAPRPDLERVALAIDNLVDVLSVELL